MAGPVSAHKNVYMLPYLEYTSDNQGDPCQCYLHNQPDKRNILFDKHPMFYEIKRVTQKTPGLRN